MKMWPTAQVSALLKPQHDLRIFSHCYSYTGVLLLYTGELVNWFPSDCVESSDALILQILSFQLQINTLKSKKLHSSLTRVSDTSEQSIRKHFRGKIPKISSALGGISLNLVLILMILRKSKAVLIAFPLTH